MGSVTVSRLGKAFKQYPSRWARLQEWLMPGHAKRHALKWALQDINFTVQSGEAVGIIGLNGAGKSTLLKLITGTLLPTTGNVSMQGRVSALLELGIGFHPDFTGRENVIIAGQLLGYEAAELAAQMSAIEAFSEIAGYLDQPVRVYSSGMQMRLAFSVATAFRPDVLIVDEALSVGDAYFQHKSFQRIRDFQKQGTTLLLVSHDKQAIQSICNRALLLGSGRVLMEGAPEAVMDYYNAMLADHQSQALSQETHSSGKVRTISGTGEASIEQVAIRDDLGDALHTVFVGQRVTIDVVVAVHEDIDSLVLGYGIKDRLGQLMFGTNTYHTDQVISNLKRGQRYQYRIGFMVSLGVGTYSVNTALVRNSSHIEKNYHWIDGALMFEVINKDKASFLGSSWNDVVFGIQRVGD